MWPLISSDQRLRCFPLGQKRKGVLVGFLCVALLTVVAILVKDSVFPGSELIAISMLWEGRCGEWLSKS